MSAASSVPRLPGVDLDVQELKNGVALVDPETRAYIYAPNEVVVEVGTTRLEGD